MEIEVTLRCDVEDEVLLEGSRKMHIANGATEIAAARQVPSVEAALYATAVRHIDEFRRQPGIKVREIVCGADDPFTAIRVSETMKNAGTVAFLDNPSYGDLLDDIPDSMARAYRAMEHARRLEDAQALIRRDTERTQAR